MDKDKIVRTAKSWLHTPYHHQAKVKLVGVDCAMLVAAVAEEVYEKPINTPVYSPEWHLHNRSEMMCELIESFGCKQINVEEADRGDILTFKFGRVNSHMGILVNKREFIHARLDIGKVVINQLSGDWMNRLGRAYRFPESL
jgi:NlpC/P60 family putative phage cell wall peptidase